MPSILLRGHHGLGDNLHQRAIVRQLIAAGNDVWIETPWPSVYHDLPVHCIRKESPLRTQAKNLEREANRFSTTPVPGDAWVIQLRYDVHSVRAAGSVLGGISCPGFDASAADFRLPVLEGWQKTAIDTLRKHGFVPARPIMFFRPLVARTEFMSSVQRNPDEFAYRKLFESIRDRYFVVSIADLEPGKEWLIGDELDADVKFHRGELTFETLAGLAYISDLVLCAPGFATVLARAVETPCATVFGGYERGYSFSAGARWSSYLAIEPIEPCDCFDRGHHCRKDINLPSARAALLEFVA